MKLQPRYTIGERVQYNSQSAAAAALGTILSVDNSKTPHIYTIQPDIFATDPDVKDICKEHDIFKTL